MKAEQSVERMAHLLVDSMVVMRAALKAARTAALMGEW